MSLDVFLIDERENKCSVVIMGSFVSVCIDDCLARDHFASAGRGRNPRQNDMTRLPSSLFRISKIYVTKWLLFSSL